MLQMSVKKKKLGACMEGKGLKILLTETSALLACSNNRQKAVKSAAEDPNLTNIAFP